MYNSELGKQFKMSHHYTTNKAESDVLVKNYGWLYDNNSKPIFYSAQDAKGNQLTGSTIVYRLYNEALSAHIYTLDASEIFNLITYEGWSGEIIGFYEYKTNNQ